MKLRPSRYASTSIDYPMGIYGRDPQDDDDGIAFICDVCRYEFFVKGYEGEWDHPPGVPICPECAEKGEQ